MCRWGFIAGGCTDRPISNDKTLASLSGNDYWVVQLNSTGDIEWDNTIGGNFADFLHSVQQLPMEDTFFDEWSWSELSGNKTETLSGPIDYRVIKLGI